MVGVSEHLWGLPFMPTGLRFQLGICDYIWGSPVPGGCFCCSTMRRLCRGTSPSPSSAGGGKEAGAGLAGASSLSLTQTAFALANPFFEL